MSEMIMSPADREHVTRRLKEIDMGQTVEIGSLEITRVPGGLLYGVRSEYYDSEQKIPIQECSNLVFVPFDVAMKDLQAINRKRAS